MSTEIDDPGESESASRIEGIKARIVLAMRFDLDDELVTLRAELAVLRAETTGPRDPA